MRKRNSGWTKNPIKIRYILTGMMLIGIMLFLAYPQNTWAKETEQVVRIAVYELPGFCEKQDGNWIGYDYEYLCEIADITGWQYEFVEIADYEEGLEKLEAKEIDFLAPACKTPEGIEKYIYSEYDFGKQYTAFITDGGRSGLSYGEFDDFQGMKVAVVENSVHTKNFMEYAAKNNLVVNYVYCDTTTQVLSMLHEKKVDAAVVNLLDCQQRDKVLLRFCQKPFYYMTYQGNEMLMCELNDAMYELQNNKPNLISNLTETYFSIYDVQYMTREQRNFIESIDYIKVGYQQDNIPVSYTDAKTGEFKGITRDILDAIQEISGLRFQYVPLPEGNVDYQYLKDNDIVITADVTYNKWNQRAGKMVVTMPYDYMNKVLIAKDNIIFYRNGALRMAISSGSQTIEKAIAAEYPNFTIQNYETTEEAFDAVLNGMVDVVLVNQYVADYWLGRPLYSSLSIIPAEGLGDDKCLAILDYSQDGDVSEYKIIKDILDAAISQLTEDDINLIIFENTINHRYQYNWKDFAYENRVEITLVIALVVLVFGAQMIISAMRKKNYQALAEKERTLAIQQKRYELIMDKSEDIIFETDLQTNASSVSGIMRDKFGWSLDSFKPSRDPDELMKCWKVHQDDVETLKKAYLETKMEAKSSECSVRLLKKDVGYVWCKVSRYPILNEKDEVVKILGNIVNIDQMTKETQRLKSQTRTDAMTGLLNKNTFIADVAAYLEEKEQTNFCMIFFDLDHFKQVNDKLGHLVGDMAIKEAAQKLQVQFANVDFVSRFGGDEFCIFVKDIPVETIKERLEFTREKLSATYEKLDQSVTITSSIGAAYYHRTEKNVQAIIDEADKAVYQAKEEGRNRVIFKEIN